MKRDGVGDGAALGRVRRMTDDSHLLVDHQQPVVLVNDVERDVLRNEPGGWRRWKNKLDRVTGGRLIARLGGQTVDRDQPLFDVALKDRPRDAPVLVAQVAVEPLAELTLVDV